MLYAVGEAAKARAAVDLPKVVVDVHPDYVAKRGARNAATGEFYFVMSDNPSPKQATEAGADVHSLGDAHFVPNASFFFGSGHIPRLTEYEKGVRHQVAFDEVSGEWKEDPLINDERYLAVEVNGLGLVVFSACSHAGVVNVLKDVKKRWPQKRVHLISGGFHLAPNQSPVSQTVTDLVALDPAFLAPGHCTGWRAHAALLAAFPDRTVPLSAGATIIVKSASK